MTQSNCTFREGRARGVFRALAAAFALVLVLPAVTYARSYLQTGAARDGWVAAAWIGLVCSWLWIAVTGFRPFRLRPPRG